MAKLKRPTPPSPRRLRTLRVLRAERDLTQHAIAAPAGITQTRYWQIEHGEGAPVRKDERAAIARLLGVAPEAIAWPAMKLTQLQRAREVGREQRRRQQAETLVGDRA